MITEITRQPDVYEVAIEDGHFVILMGFDWYCVSLDTLLSRALVNLPYVASTSLIKPANEAYPYTLLVSTHGPLTGARVEEMTAAARDAYERNEA